MALIEKDVHFILMELCSKHPSNKLLMSEATELLALLATDSKVLYFYTFCRRRGVNLDYKTKINSCHCFISKFLHLSQKTNKGSKVKMGRVNMFEHAIYTPFFTFFYPVFSVSHHCAFGIVLINILTGRYLRSD